MYKKIYLQKYIITSLIFIVILSFDLTIFLTTKDRVSNLDIYLTTISKLNPEAILVGNSPVYMGSCQTGIPFTDEYKIGNKKISLLKQKDHQGYEIITDTEEKWKREYSSEVVWNGLEMELNNMWMNEKGFCRICE